MSSSSYESAEEVFRATADIVTNRAKQNKEEVSSRWEPLFNNLGHCCRKNKKYKEALEYHQYVRILFKKISLYIFNIIPFTGPSTKTTITSNLHSNWFCLCSHG